MQSKKTQMTITVISAQPPQQQSNAQGSWTSQMAKIGTGRSEHTCFNNGPTWFDQYIGQQVSVMGEWKADSKNPGQYMLSCSFQQAGAVQGTPPPQTATPPPTTAAPAATAQPVTAAPPYNLPAPIQDDMQIEDIPGKCRCLVICAAVQSKQIKCETPGDANKLVEYIVTGTYPRPATAEQPAATAAGPDGPDYPQQQPPATAVGAPTGPPTAVDGLPISPDDGVPF